MFKALALGAKAVGVGRPFLWGLGAFGQAGVDRVIDILQGDTSSFQLCAAEAEPRFPAARGFSRASRLA